jgi:hypothetical protein
VWLIWKQEQQGETTALQALAWVEAWVDIQQGAYRALGMPHGDDDGLLRLLKARDPLRKQ